MNNTLNDDQIYYDSQTNQIVAILLPIVIGCVGITYFCCKHYCKKNKNKPHEQPLSSTAPIVIQV
jgi:hypothetical protein